MVEAALVLPVLFLLIFGALDFGLLFRDDLTIANMTRVGGRAGSVAGNSALADYDLLTATAGAATALQGGINEVNYVIVFDADCVAGSGCDPSDAQSPPSATVPAACLTAASSGSAGVVGSCNIYSTKYLLSPSQGGYLTTTNFGCGTGVADVDWCPTGRGVVTTQDDYLGLYVKLTHRMATGFFGASKVLTDTVVYRLEPVAIS